MPAALFILCLIFIFTSAPASASNWLKCRGTATVVSAAPDENGGWVLKARTDKAAVTAGFGAAGDDCPEAYGDVDIQSKTEYAAETVVTFDYSYYGGMGANGPVTSRSWTVAE